MTAARMSGAALTRSAAADGIAESLVKNDTAPLDWLLSAGEDAPKGRTWGEEGPTAHCCGSSSGSSYD